MQKKNQVMDYNITNKIERAEAKSFFRGFLGSEKDTWTYTLLVTSNSREEVTATVKVPKRI